MVFYHFGWVFPWISIIFGGFPMVFPLDFGATAVPSGPGRRGAPPRDHAPGPGAEAHGDRAAGGGHGRRTGGLGRFF